MAGFGRGAVAQVPNLAMHLGLFGPGRIGIDGVPLLLCARLAPDCPPVPCSPNTTLPAAVARRRPPRPPWWPNTRRMMFVHASIGLPRHLATRSDRRFLAAHAYPCRHGRTLRALTALYASRASQCGRARRRFRPIRRRLVRPAHRPRMRTAYGLAPSASSASSNSSLSILPSSDTPILSMRVYESGPPPKW